MVMVETTVVPLPPPQPEMPPSTAVENAITSHSDCERRRAPASSQPPRLRASTAAEAPCSMVRLLAAKVTVVETGVLPDGATVDGLKEQETPAGSPEQAKAMVELKPLTGVTFRVTGAVSALVTVPLVAPVESEKSAGVGEFTVTETSLEVLDAKLLSPPYCAVKEWLPTDSVDVV